MKEKPKTNTHPTIDWLVDFNYGIDFDPNMTERLKYAINYIQPEYNIKIKNKNSVDLERKIFALSKGKSKENWPLRLTFFWYLSNRNSDYIETFLNFLEYEEPPFTESEIREIRERLIAPLIIFWKEVKEIKGVI